MNWPESTVASPETMDLPAFLRNYRDKLRNIFSVRTDIDKLSLQRGLPPFVLRQIMSCHPLSVWIPEEHGGRGGRVHECLSMLETSSYESLALSLVMGINGALFLQPVSKYGREEIKPHVFDRFINQQNLGGLMITEPEFGSDALRMQTSYREEQDGYRIKGVKHWGGLTGWADFWLITARRADLDGNLSRDIDFIVYDCKYNGIVVEEVFENLGLYMIPYGRNRIDARVPKENKLEPHSTGITMMLDLLHRSRLQFPGMGMGFLRRMLDEAIQHCRTRYIGGKSLLSYDQVQSRVAKLQSSVTLCSAMCTYTSEKAGVENDLSRESVSANSVKSVITDVMQDASQSLLQLFGAKGYRIDHIAGRSTVDSRSFQIFEGSNDILYQQVAEAVLKSMRGLKEINLYQFLKDYQLTSRAADYFKETCNFSVDLKMPQRKMVELGRALGRIVSLEMVIELEERGFRSDLVNSCASVLCQEVESLISSYSGERNPAVIEDRPAPHDWLAYISPAS